LGAWHRPARRSLPAPTARSRITKSEIDVDQAQQLLPAVLESLSIDAAADRLWLLGQSDGGSIALLYMQPFTQNALLAPSCSCRTLWWKTCQFRALKKPVQPIFRAILVSVRKSIIAVQIRLFETGTRFGWIPDSSNGPSNKT